MTPKKQGKTRRGAEPVAVDPKAPKTEKPVPEGPSLTDLFPERPEETSSHKREVATAELWPLVKNHPAEPSKAFIDGVRAAGILFPVIIAWRADKLEIKDGIRRIKAAQAVGLKTVPARLFRDLRGAAGAAATLIANYHRSSNPVQELKAIETLLEAAGSEKRLAAMVGIPLGTVKRRLKLRALIRELRQAFDRGQLGPAIAEKAAGLKPAAQQRLARKLAARRRKDPKARLTAKDVRGEREVGAQEVSAELSDSLFPDLPEGISTELTPEEREALRGFLMDGGMPPAAVTRSAVAKLLAGAYLAGSTNQDRMLPAEYASTRVTGLVQGEQ